MSREAPGSNVSKTLAPLTLVKALLVPARHSAVPDAKARRRWTKNDDAD
jgi:hypothetical protein